MSVVAVKVYEDKIVMGADSQSTSYWHNKNSVNKIYKISDNFIIGGVGYTSHNQLMSLYCETTKPVSCRKRDILEFFVSFNQWMRKQMDDFKPYNSFLIAYENCAYWVTEDLCIEEVKDYCTIGSGNEYAKAALYFDKNIEDAIKVACDLTIYCSPPIEIYEIKRSKK